MKWVSVASLCLGFLSVFLLMMSAIEERENVRGYGKIPLIGKIAAWGRRHSAGWNQWSYYLKLAAGIGALVAISLQIVVQVAS